MREFDDHHLPSYSCLMEWLERIPLSAASPSQWLATIEAAKGIREEEKERSELMIFLGNFDDEHTDRKVTKSELLKNAREGLSVCRIELLTERSTIYRPALQFELIDPETIPQRVLNTFHNQQIFRSSKLPSFDYKIIGVRYEDMFGVREGWFIYDNHWRLIRPNGCFMNLLPAVDAMYSAAANNFNKYISPTPSCRYEQYSLLGKRKNYREWLVTLPDWHATFFGNHFNLKNVVLHLRSSNWKANDGTPVFLVDEIQSDWHAKGRDYGYFYGNKVDDDSDSAPDSPFIREWHELGIKIAIWIALRSNHSCLAFTTAQLHCDRWSELGGLRLLYDQHIPKALEKLARKFGCRLDWKEITVDKPRDNIRYQQGVGWELRAPGDKAKKRLVKNELVAMRFWQNKSNKYLEKVRVLEISPALMKVVKAKGVPLFGWWESAEA